MLQLCSVLFLCGLLKLCGLLNFFLHLISLMAGHAAIVRCAIFVQFAQIERIAKYFFLLLISLMVRHAAIMQCAILVQFAKIMQSAKFFSPFNFSNGRTCCNYAVCYFCAVC